MRKLWAGLAVLVVLATTTATAHDADALGTGGGTSTLEDLDNARPTVGAGLIVSVIGDVTPEAGAAESAGMALSNGNNGALNSAGLGGALNLLSHVPGFKLGYKIGEYIDSATGLYDPAAGTSPDTSNAPYSLAADGSGWVNADMPWSDYNSNGHGFNSLYVVPNTAVFVAGQGIPADSLIGQVSAVAVTDGSGNDNVKAAAEAQIWCTTSDGTGSVASGLFASYEVNNSATFGVYGNSGAFTDDTGITASRDVCDPGTSINGHPVTGFDHLYVSQYQDIGFGSSTEGAAPAVAVPAGSDLWYPGGAVGLGREYERISHCIAHDGTASTVTGFSAAFRETDTTFPPYPAADCPPGTVLTGTEVDLVHDDNQADIGTIAGTAETFNDWTSWLQSNPACDQGQCPVTLEYTDGSTWHDCFASPSHCVGWWDDPSKASDYRCTQNGNVLALSDCNYYRQTFDQWTGNGTIGLSDPRTGATVTAPSTLPIDNPVTTTPTTAPTTAPTSTPTTGPTTTPGGGGATTTPSPTPTAQPTSTTTTAPMPITVPDQPTSNSCWSGFWSFNPIDWVLVPIKCAFIPSETQVQSRVDQVNGAYQSTTLADWVTVVGSVGTGITGSSDCAGPSWTLPAILGGQTLHPLSTCDNPWHTVALVVHALLSVFLAWICAVTVLKNLSSAFGLELHIRSGGT